MVILSLYFHHLQSVSRMAESSKATTLSRQALIKAEMKGFLPHSRLNSRWEEISDTNLGTFNLAAFKIRMFGTAGHGPSPIAVKIVKSGIVATAGFPPTIQCSDLVQECATHYKLERKTISTPDGNIVSRVNW